MARDTDRKKVSEAVRLALKAGKTIHLWSNTTELLNLGLADGGDLEVHYGSTQRIRKVVHWVPIKGTESASRTPIDHGKLKYVLGVLS